jgi:DNA-binding MarR family transcriptional regulator
LASGARPDDPRLQLLEQAKRVRLELDAEAEQAAEVTFHQAQVLALVEAQDSQATVSKMAPVLDRAVHTLPAAVDGMERKGLVQRFANKGEDRRIVRAGLTGAGNDALAKLRETDLPLP